MAAACTLTSRLHACARHHVLVLELDFVTFWLIRACILLVVSSPVAEGCVFYIYGDIVHVSNVHQSGF